MPTPATTSDDSKKLEEQKRHEEKAAYDQIEEKKNREANKAHYQWQMGLEANDQRFKFEKIGDRAAMNAAAEAAAKTANEQGGLESGVTKNSFNAELVGLWKLTEEHNLRVTEQNGRYIMKVSPIIRSEEQFTRVHDRAMDFMAAEAGVTCIEYDVPGKGGGLSYTRLLSLFKLAEQKGLDIAIGPSLQSYIDSTYSAKQVRNIEQARMELSESAYQGELMRGASKAATFTEDKKMIEKGPEILPTTFAETKVNQTTAANAALSGAATPQAAAPTDVTPTAPPVESKTVVTLSDIEAVQEKISQRLNTVNRALQDITSHTNACDQMLAKIDHPESLKRPEVLKKFGYHSKEWIEKEHKNYTKDPVLFAKKITADYDNSSSSKKELMETLMKERSELDKHQAACDSKLADIKKAPDSLSADDKKKLPGVIEKNEELKKSLPTTEQKLTQAKADDTKLSAKITEAKAGIENKVDKNKVDKVEGEKRRSSGPGGPGH